MTSADRRTRNFLRAAVPFAILASFAAPRAASAQSTMDGSWNWLKNTYWIVPTPYLPSLLLNTSTNVLIPAVDQTVYHITDYRLGYFWGKNVSQVGKLPVNCSSLVGSVTPDGKVLLTFTTVSSNGTATAQQGFGAMVLKGRAWTMLNQTSTAAFSHWAYMVQSKPGEASWNSLPGVGKSVPDFLAQCPGSGPRLGR